eukprot:TRINITY_DN16182_c0_g2_i1.p1 TRINITY_DN16182_c0_g2~~TRINITY_DN16182_c0_g2_i1.p1  ORF type:complete len:1134 (+),score=90.23 TRINITY_DN16182_c0_g2_i1:59-3460(+)
MGKRVMIRMLVALLSTCRTGFADHAKESARELSSSCGSDVGPIRWHSHPDKCLDAKDGQLFPGTQMQIWRCNEHQTSMRFKWSSSDCRIRLEKNQSLCVGASSPQNGANMVLEKCSSSTYTVQKGSGDVGKLSIQGHGSACLDVKDHDNLDGTGIQIWECIHGDDDQIFATGRAAGIDSLSGGASAPASSTQATTPTPTPTPTVCGVGCTTIGPVRIHALSPSLVRVEAKGPMGFEDKRTFAVTGRSHFEGIPVTTDYVYGHHIVKTSYYQVRLRDLPHVPPPNCHAPIKGDCLGSGPRIQGGIIPPWGHHVGKNNRGACCKKCEESATCTVWTYDPGSGMCWTLLHCSWVAPSNMESGCSAGKACASFSRPVFDILDSDGETVLHEQTAQQTPIDNSNLLNWPAPLQASSYALVDFPRFVPPQWGVHPTMSAGQVDPALSHSNGFDFRNNVDGDIYVFLLGRDKHGWQHSREEFLKLTGPCPLLPDYAYGTWNSWYHPYSFEQVKDHIKKWDQYHLPIDVWGLDRNWRFTGGKGMEEEHHYDMPNKKLFPQGFKPWFDFIKERRMHSYFNDHPWPVDEQTTPKEVSFRWQGLKKWLQDGLTFWWVDMNWAWSLPPPNSDAHSAYASWFGLTGNVWGSYVFYSLTEHFYNEFKVSYTLSSGESFPERPISLSKSFTLDAQDENVLDDPRYLSAAAHHRYPVWWTGDFVTIQASVEAMVISGLRDFKPFVHSDCGGDYKGSAGDFMRWAQFCAFGTILRFHGEKHLPWEYGPDAREVVKYYLNTRYKLIPALISAGQRVTATGKPIVERCDFQWPEHAPRSSSNHQYMFLEHMLVAPVLDLSSNWSTRAVWIPPGSWQDVWTGGEYQGGDSGKTVLVSKPYEQIPVFIRSSGGLLLQSDSPGSRVRDDGWDNLTLEAYPSDRTEPDSKFTRTLFELGSAARTTIVFTSGGGLARVNIELDHGAHHRQWHIRFHLRKGQHPGSPKICGGSCGGFTSWYKSGCLESEVFPPIEEGERFLPFRGAYSPPAHQSGVVVQVSLKKDNVSNLCVEMAIDGQIEPTSLVSDSGTVVYQSSGSQMQTWKQVLFTVPAFEVGLGVMLIVAAAAKLGRSFSKGATPHREYDQSKLQSDSDDIEK